MLKINHLFTFSTRSTSVCLIVHLNQFLIGQYIKYDIMRHI